MGTGRRRRRRQNRQGLRGLGSVTIPQTPTLGQPAPQPQQPGAIQPGRLTARQQRRVQTLKRRGQTERAERARQNFLARAGGTPGQVQQPGQTFNLGTPEGVIGAQTFQNIQTAQQQANLNRPISQITPEGTRTISQDPVTGQFTILIRCKPTDLGNTKGLLGQTSTRSPQLNYRAKINM